MSGKAVVQKMESLSLENSENVDPKVVNNKAPFKLHNQAVFQIKVNVN